MQATPWSAGTDQYFEYRNNPTLDAMEYVANRLPLLKDEIFEKLNFTEEWERYSHISDVIIKEWSRSKADTNSSNPIFQIGSEATEKSFQWMRSWNDEVCEFQEKNLKKQISYKKAKPISIGHSAYLTSDKNFKPFLDGVFSAYCKENPSFNPILDDAIGCDQLSTKFQETIFALPLFIGHLEPSRLLHVEMIAQHLRRHCVVKSFYLYLPEYNDANSRRWAEAAIKTSADYLAVDFTVYFGKAKNEEDRDSDLFKWNPMD
jgi:hypothetical protein